MDALTIAYHHSIRPSIRDAIFDLIGEDIDPLLILADADGLLNFDTEVGLPSAQIRRWFQQEADYSIASYTTPDEAVIPLHHQDLLDRIRKSTPEQFCKIIRFLRTHDDIADELTVTVTVALSKRLRRALKNDPLYYSILTNSVMVSSMTLVEYHYLDDDNGCEDYDN